MVYLLARPDRGDRVRQTKESVIRMTDRHFTAPVEEISGTVDSVSPGGGKRCSHTSRILVVATC